MDLVIKGIGEVGFICICRTCCIEERIGQGRRVLERWRRTVV
jgi:hypothetical protein